MDNIWGPDMQLINKFNKGIRLLLCVINIFSKYPWVASLKDKKSVTMLFKQFELSVVENQKNYG